MPRPPPSSIATSSASQEDLAVLSTSLPPPIPPRSPSPPQPSSPPQASSPPFRRLRRRATYPPQPWSRTNRAIPAPSENIFAAYRAANEHLAHKILDLEAENSSLQETIDDLQETLQQQPTSNRILWCHKRRLERERHWPGERNVKLMDAIGRWKAEVERGKGRCVELEWTKWMSWEAMVAAAEWRRGFWEVLVRVGLEGRGDEGVRRCGWGVWVGLNGWIRGRVGEVAAGRMKGKAHEAREA